MRAVLATILLCLASCAAQARPSPYPSVTPFSGDRYVAHAQMGADVARAVKAKTGAKPRYLYPTRKRPPVTRQRWKHVPVPVPRPVTTGEYRADASLSQNSASFDDGKRDMAPLTVFEGVKREAGRAAQAITESAGDRRWRRSSRLAQVVGGRPSGCPHAYCGCGASIHLFGRIIPALNLAANWLRFPRALPAPRMAAARRGHVFVLEHHISGKVWMVFDANSGRGRTRLHPRSIAGYQIVNPHSG